MKMINNMNNIIELAYKQLNEHGEGGCSCGGGDAGGASAPAAGDAGSGISSGSVLGNCDHSDSDSGYMGTGCFHVPFPTMPMISRYGWTTSKKKAKKNTTTYKNPYAKGSVIITDSESMLQKKTAAQIFEMVTQFERPILTNVLYFNNRLRRAWMLNEVGELTIYAPKTSIRHSGNTIGKYVLQQSGKWKLVSESGKYATIDECDVAIHNESVRHYMKTYEALEFKSNYVMNIQPAEVKKTFDFWNAHNMLSDRVSFEQFKKNFNNDSAEIVGLEEKHFGQMAYVALATIIQDYADIDDVYINEIQSFNKGAGKKLITEIVKRHGSVWLMANPTQPESLVEYYRSLDIGFKEYVIKHSIWDGKPAHFFYTTSIDDNKLTEFIDQHYSKQD